MAEYYVRCGLSVQISQLRFIAYQLVVCHQNKHVAVTSLEFQTNNFDSPPVLSHRTQYYRPMWN
jgi:hypothetical protein